MRHIRRELISAIVLVLFIATLAATAFAAPTFQTQGERVVREYSLGEGYTAREVVVGDVTSVKVKFPARYAGVVTQCSPVLFAEATMTAILKAFKDKTFLNGVPMVEMSTKAEGALFYTDTLQGDRIEVMIMVDNLMDRRPIGVHLTLTAMPRN